MRHFFWLRHNKFTTRLTNFFRKNAKNSVNRQTSKKVRCLVNEHIKTLKFYRKASEKTSLASLKRTFFGMAWVIFYNLTVAKKPPERNVYREQMLTSDYENPQKRKTLISLPQHYTRSNVIIFFRHNCFLFLIRFLPDKPFRHRLVFVGKGKSLS